MKKFILTAFTAVALAASVTGAQAALTTVQQNYISGLKTQLVNCPVTGEGNCASLIAQLSTYLKGAAISADDRKSFVAAAAGYALANNTNGLTLVNFDLASLNAEYGDLITVGGGDGFTFSGAIFSAGCA